MCEPRSARTLRRHRGGTTKLGQGPAAQSAQRYGVTVVIVSHDPAISQHVDRMVAIYDGRTSFERVRRVDKGVVVGQDEYVVVDKTGRLQIPPELVEHLGIVGRARMHLAKDHLEIWPATEANDGGE